MHLVSPIRWNEGGNDIVLEIGDDSFVTGARTIGRHPYVFLYDPRPLWRELRGPPFDVIDVHEEPASLAHLEVRLLVWLARQRSAPMLCYGAQNIDKRFPVPFRWFERSALRRCAGVYVCNLAAGNIYRRKGFTGLVRHIGLGVDIERFTPGASKSLSRTGLRVGYVGRLEEHKGVQVVLEALSGTDHELHIYGSGPYEPQLRTLAAKTPTQAYFHVPCPSDQLPNTYRSFDLLVMPSQDRRNWMEQFGRVAVEAMACGVPVVASRSGSLPEVVGDAGMLIQPDDVRAWRKAIDDLAADPEHRARLATAGPHRAAQFSWSAIATQHHDLYCDVVKATTCRSASTL
jgi:glycosyltransferase involved in cell wall biosynthesis